MSNASASSDTYRREDMCGGVANSTGYINPGWFHTAKLTGLQPSTDYLYSYGDEVHPPAWIPPGVPVSDAEPPVTRIDAVSQSELCSHK